MNEKIEVYFVPSFKTDMYINEELRSTLFGAINKPTMHVNKSNDITLGFIKLTNEFKFKAKPSLEFLAFESIWLNLLYFRQLFKSMERWR